MEPQQAHASGLLPGQNALDDGRLLPLESGKLIDHAALEDLSALEDGAVTEQCAIDGWNMPADQLALCSMDDLRDLHSMLSEHIVAANRELARAARPDNLNGHEVRAVRDQLVEP